MTHLPTLCCLTAFLMTGAWGAWAAGLELHHVGFRCPSGLDTGTVEVFLHNKGADPCAVTEVILDGVPLPVRGVYDASDPPGRPPGRRIQVYLDPSMALSGKRALWAYLDPNPLPPGALGVLRLKFAEKPSRLINVALKTRDGQVLQKVIPPENATFRLTGIVFDESCRKLYVYAENKTAGALHFDRVFVDGQDATESALLLPPELPAGEKAPIVVARPEGWQRGPYVLVKVTTTEGTTAAERDRAVAYFAVGVESGGGPAGLSLDSIPFSDPYTQSLDKTAGRTKYIFSCPMHAYGGDLRRCGDEIVRRHLAYSAGDPVAMTGVHICRTAVERGCFLFGEAADSVRANPFVQSAYFRPSREHPEHSAQWLTALAKRGCQPRPLFTVLDLSGCPLPEHDRQGIGFTPRLGAFYVLSRGARGVLYRFGDWLKDPENSAQIAALNAELQSLKTYLAIAEPFGTTSTSDPRAEASLLMCGDRGALLVVVNHMGLPAEEGGAGAHAPLKSIRVTIPARSWLNPKRALPLPAAGDRANELPVSREGKDLSLTIPELDQALVYLLR